MFPDYMIPEIHSTQHLLLNLVNTTTWNIKAELKIFQITKMGGGGGGGGGG